jgi:uncharacterized protein (TIGR02598 family)
MKRFHPTRGGFSLVETVIALGVVSFCLLNVMALLPIGLASNRDSLQKTAAASIAAEVSSDLRQAPVTVGSASQSPRFQIGQSSTTSTTTVLYFGSDDSFLNGTASGATVSGNWLYRATVTVGATTSGSTVPVRILVTWPALADSNPSLSPANYTGSLDISTAVNTLSR